MILNRLKLLPILLSHVILLSSVIVGIFLPVQVMASEIKIHMPLKAIPTDKLVKMLLKKYDVKSIDDVRPWDTAEELAEFCQTESCRPKQYKVPPYLIDLLSVLGGFRSVGLNIFVPSIPHEPLLLEILNREDCPVKFIFIPKADQQTQAYMYNTQKAHSEQDAYLLVLKNLEYSHRTATWDEKNARSYIDGLIFGYPEGAIKAYIGEKNWQAAKSLGDAWLNKNRHKSIDMLTLEIWQLIQQQEKAKWLQPK
jgi:uncharacterized protein YneF (UPF0154 family)